jgi:hypothetical protein
MSQDERLVAGEGKSGALTPLVFFHRPFGEQVAELGRPLLVDYGHAQSCSPPESTTSQGNAHAPASTVSPPVPSQSPAA